MILLMTLATPAPKTPIISLIKATQGPRSQLAESGQNRAAQDTSPLLAPLITEANGVFMALTLLASRYSETTLK